MNTKLRLTRILCYGDSNTWGKIPGPRPVQRYLVNERWTGLLQSKLGDNFEIIEEGLNSRTTNLDDPDPSNPGRNGALLLMPILETHNPIDMIILMLGTNDLKTQYNRQPADVLDGIRNLIEVIDTFAHKIKRSRPNLLLVSPPLVKEVPGREMYSGAATKSQQLASLYQKFAHDISRENEVCLFLNAAQHVQSSDVDGVHLERKEHQKLADAIYQLITSKYLDKQEY